MESNIKPIISYTDIQNDLSNIDQELNQPESSIRNANFVQGNQVILLFPAPSFCKMIILFFTHIL